MEQDDLNPNLQNCRQYQTCSTLHSLTRYPEFLTIYHIIIFKKKLSQRP